LGSFLAFFAGCATAEASETGAGCEQRTEVSWVARDSGVGRVVRRGLRAVVGCVEMLCVVSSCGAAKQTKTLPFIAVSADWQGKEANEGDIETSSS